MLGADMTARPRYFADRPAGLLLARVLSEHQRAHTMPRKKKADGRVKNKESRCTRR
jgi:hypothetical protein